MASLGGAGCSWHGVCALIGVGENARHVHSGAMGLWQLGVSAALESFEVLQSLHRGKALQRYTSGMTC